MAFGMQKYGLLLLLPLESVRGNKLCALAGVTDAMRALLSQDAHQL